MEKETSKIMGADNSTLFAAVEALKALESLRENVESLCEDRQTQIQTHKGFADVEFYLRAIKLDAENVNDDDYKSEDFKSDCMKY